jgi:mono/diheme cytochrome c family protein
MYLRRIAAIVIGAVMLLTYGCGPAPADRRSRTDPSNESEAAYLQACASCHGRDGRGGGPVAAVLTTAPADLTMLAVRHGGGFPRAYVVDVVTGARAVRAHGTREMPIWSEQFGSSVSSVASAYARRRIDLLVSHLEAMQRADGVHGVP